VGDLFDFFVKAPDEHRNKQLDLVSKIFELSSCGTEIVYIPGNHDSVLKLFSGSKIKGVSIVDEYVHTTIDNKEIKLLHGDKFDNEGVNRFILPLFGVFGYGPIFMINKLVYKFNKNFCLCRFIKSKTANIFNTITTYEKNVTNELTNSDYYGIMYGHTHFPKIKNMNEKIIANTGSWTADNVNSCIVEELCGDFKLLNVNKLGQPIN